MVTLIYKDLKKNNNNKWKKKKKKKKKTKNKKKKSKNVWTNDLNLTDFNIKEMIDYLES